LCSSSALARRSEFSTGTAASARVWKMKEGGKEGVTWRSIE
jgi:hypothetical protein